MKFNKKWLWLIIPLIIFSLCWINSSSVSTVLLAIKGTITDGNLVKFSGTAGLGEDAGIATETTLTTDSDAKIPTSKAVNYFCETTKGYLITESDPNALLTAGTDNIKDTHINWGVAATQVSGADMPILESAYTVDNALDVGLRNGIYSGLLVTVESGINISWTAGVAYVDGSLFAVNSDASEDIADNDITYLYALKDNATLQESTTEPTTGVVGEFALVCILHTYATGVHEKFDFPYMSGELRYDLWKFLDDITPTATVGGCNTAIDTDATLANDFTIATGTYYVDIFDLNTISSILYSSTETHDGNGLTAFYHVASAWSSGAENGVNFSQWDNGTAKASTVANKWYVAWIYVEDGDTIYYVYPQTQHDNEGSALAEGAKYPPYHQGIVLPSARFIFRHGVSGFGTTSYFIDTRPFFGYSDGGPIAQMIYQTVTGDSGSTTATASDDSIAIVGGGIAETAVTADTVTITATIPAEHIDSDMYTDASIDHEHLAPDVISGMVDVTADDLDYMLIWDNTDSALKRVDMAEVLGAGAGEANTASNIGFVSDATTPKIYKQKTGVDLELRVLKEGTAVELTWHEVTGNWDIGNASYDNKLKDTTPQDTDMSDVFVGSSGSKMYAVGHSNNRVYEYNVSTPYDITTASYLQYYDPTSEAAWPIQAFFNSNGEKMYVLDSTTDTIYQYTLSSGWDVTSATYATKSFSVNSEESSPAGFCLSSDGVKLYVVGSGATIYQYTLSSGWDISSAGYDTKSKDVSGQDLYPSDVYISTNGDTVFMVGSSSGNINQYALSTPYDISTAAYSKLFDVSTQTPKSYGVCFSSEGDKFFIMDNTDDDVHQYIITPEITYYDYIEIGVVPGDIKLDDLGAPDDNTDNDVSTSAHGLMPKLPFSGDLLSTTTVAFDADADTTLYTVPSGKRCVLSHAIVVAAGDAGASTTVSIGQNTAETDFVPANTLSNLDAQYDAVILMPIPNTTPLKIKSYAADTVIEAQVASQSGAAGNTIYLFGILY